MHSLTHSLIRSFIHFIIFLFLLFCYHLYYYEISSSFIVNQILPPFYSALAANACLCCYRVNISRFPIISAILAWYYWNRLFNNSSGKDTKQKHHLLYTALLSWVCPGGSDCLGWVWVVFWHITLSVGGLQLPDSHN